MKRLEVEVVSLDSDETTAESLSGTLKAVVENISPDERPRSKGAPPLGREPSWPMTDARASRDVGPAQ